MKNSHIDFFPSHRLHAERGQGLLEYAILLALIAVITIAALTLTGGSVQQGIIEICAELGNGDCQTAENEPVVSGTATPQAVSTTPPSSPTATLELVDPDPTREPVVDVIIVEPTTTPVRELITMRIKVVVNGKNKDDATAMGIRIVIYDNAGTYVAQGMTDDKGNLSFSVPSGTYTVATFYDDEWQKHGPFNVKNSKQNVIHLGK